MFARLFAVALVGALLASCAGQSGAPVEDRLRRPDTRTVMYTVKPRDTLYRIAWQHNLDYKDIAQANDIDSPYTIYPGQRLRLPGVVAAREKASPASAARTNAPSARPQTEQTAKATPQRTRPAATAARTRQQAPPKPAAARPKPAPKPAATAAAPRPKPAAPKPKPAAKPAQRPPFSHATLARGSRSGWQRPVAANPVRRFGGDSKGFDYALDPATRIHAASAGVVVYAGPGLGGYRHLVIVKQSDRYLVAYGVNVEPSLQEGQTVRPGTVVAEVDGGGTDGRFHFEIRDRGKEVDPKLFIGG